MLTVGIKPGEIAEQWGTDAAYRAWEIVSRPYANLGDQERKQKKGAALNYANWIAKWLSKGVQADYSSIADFLFAEDREAIRGLINKEPEEVAALSRAWHRRRFGTGDSTGVMEGRDVVLDLGDGWAWVRVPDAELEREGDLMGHCVGDYCEQVRADEIEVLSLRSPKNRPHVTVGVALKWDEATGEVDWDSVFEIKGRSNEPVVERYEPAVIKLLDFLGVADTSVDFHPSSKTVEAEVEKTGWTPVLMEFFADGVREFRVGPYKRLGKSLAAWLKEEGRKPDPEIPATTISTLINSYRAPVPVLEAIVDIAIHEPSLYRWYRKLIDRAIFHSRLPVASVRRLANNWMWASTVIRRGQIDEELTEEELRELINVVLQDIAAGKIDTLSPSVISIVKDPSTLRRLWNLALDPKLYLSLWRGSILANPRTPVDVLWEAWENRDNPDSPPQSLLSNPNVPPAILEATLEETKLTGATKPVLLENPSLPVKSMWRAYQRPEDRAALARNPSAPPALLAAIADNFREPQSPGRSTWLAVAKNPNTPVDVLWAILEDERVDDVIASLVLANPSFPRNDAITLLEKARRGETDEYAWMPLLAGGRSYKVWVVTLAQTESPLLIHEAISLVATDPDRLVESARYLVQEVKLEQDHIRRLFRLYQTVDTWGTWNIPALLARLPLDEETARQFIKEEKTMQSIGPTLMRNPSIPDSMKKGLFKKYGR